LSVAAAASKNPRFSSVPVHAAAAPAPADAEGDGSTDDEGDGVGAGSALGWSGSDGSAENVGSAALDAGTSVASGVAVGRDEGTQPTTTATVSAARIAGKNRGRRIWAG
jgi:hypothetical protein